MMKLRSLALAVVYLLVTVERIVSNNTLCFHNLLDALFLGESVKHKVVSECGHECRLLRIGRTSVAPFNVFVVIDGPLIVRVREFLE